MTSSYAGMSCYYGCYGDRLLFKHVLPGRFFISYSWKDIFIYYWNRVWSFFHLYNNCHSDMHTMQGTVSHTPP